MFQIKVCGITRVEDAIAASAAGVDAIGLNFFEASPRSVAAERAAEIVRALPSSVVKVGVFVHHSPRAVTDLFDRLGLDFAQLHGEQSAEFVARLSPRPVIRAFRGNLRLAAVAEYVRRCAQAHAALAAVLVDAHVPGQYGGTGICVDWHEVAAWKRLHREIPLILSGGLNPRNVSQAIQVAGPDAVDAASGVERGPGWKDAELVAQFAAAARQAFAAASPNDPGRNAVSPK